MVNSSFRATSTLMTIMANAVFKAARGMVRDFNEVEHLQVSQKGPGNFVSAADLRSEKILRAELSKARPDFAFLLEESGKIDGRDLSHRWIVDPLDGTTNFLHGIPHFSISVALEQDGDIIAGIVYDPIKNELFCAEKGKGAFCNNRRLRVSGRRSLADGLVGMCRGYDPKAVTATGYDDDTILRRMTARIPTIRHYGAATLDLCYVAAGRFDGFWSVSLTPWDLAAGGLIIKEAGGYLSTLDGKPYHHETPDVVAGSDHFHPSLVTLIRG